MNILPEPIALTRTISRVRYMRVRRFAVWLLAMVLIVGVGYLSYRNWPPLSTCPKMTGDHVIVTFGTGREPLSRATTVTSEPTETGTSAAAQNAPQSLSVRLNEDLRLQGEQGEIPTSQVTVGSTRLSDRRVTVTATVDPGQPEQVVAGCYTGDIVVEAGTGAVQRIPLLVDLGTRGGWRALAAFGVLLVGALTGLAVKWITESLTPLGAQRRRLDSLRRALRLPEGKTEVLPVDAQVAFDEIEDRIRRGDLLGLDEKFKELETEKGSLRRMYTRLSRLDEILRQQEDTATPSLSLFARRGAEHRRIRDIDTIIDREQRELARVRDLNWPTEKEKILEQCERLERWFLTVSLFNQKYRDHPTDTTMREVRDLYHAGKFEEAEGRFLARNVPDPTRPQAEYPDESPPPDLEVGAGWADTAESPYAFEPTRALPARNPFSAVDWAARKARPFAAIASVIIVALVGLKLQYLELPGFQNSLGDWLTLFLWAAVVELSGVSVLDVVGRLGTSGVPTAPR